MIEYAILGTSHEIQHCRQFEHPLIEAVREHHIELVAEEYPFDIASTIAVAAGRLHIPYLQVDLSPSEWRAHEIDWELRMRAEVPCLQNEDVRLSHADGIREDIWLEKIEKKLKHGRVLLVCGYLHVHFLADNIQRRGAHLLAKVTFPDYLLGRSPTRTLSPTELQSFVREKQWIGG